MHKYLVAAIAVGDITENQYLYCLIVILMEKRGKQIYEAPSATVLQGFAFVGRFNYLCFASY